MPATHHHQKYPYTNPQTTDRIRHMNLTLEIPKDAIKEMIQRVIEEVALSRGVGWSAILAPDRSTPEVASARVFAMAICCSANIPVKLVAQSFGRTWQTVDSARQRQTLLCRNDHEHAFEFIRILYKVFQPHTLP